MNNPIGSRLGFLEEAFAHATHVALLVNAGDSSGMRTVARAKMLRRPSRSD
jgi:hypothetical protein